MTSVQERIKSLVRAADIPVRTFAEKIGVSNVSVYKWMRGESMPQGKQLEALCEFTGATPAWVIYGDGNAPQGQTIAIDDETISIPLLDVRGSCGGGSYPACESMTALIRMVRVTLEFIRKFAPSANLRGLHLVTATGDSMEPTIRAGDAILVDSTNTTITSDGIYAIQFENGIFIKRVQCQPVGVILVSDNKLYSPIAVTDTSTLKVIGRCHVGFCIKPM